VSVQGQELWNEWTESVGTPLYEDLPAPDSEPLVGYGEIEEATESYQLVSENGDDGWFLNYLHNGDNLLSNAVVYTGVEAYKNVLDVSFLNPPANGVPAVGAGFSNNVGFVNTVNTSTPLGIGKVRGQAGVSVGAYDVKGRDVGNVRAEGEQQIFFTGGLYKLCDPRHDDPLSWGIVCDHLSQVNGGFNGTGDYAVAQCRGLISYSTSPRNEFGLWFTAGLLEDNVNAAIGTLRTVDQYNAFYRHHFDHGGSAMLYVGAVDHISAGSWTMGTQLVAPLSNCIGLYTNWDMMFPSAPAGSIGSDQMLWSVSSGIVISFGGKCRSSNATCRNTLALIPVANNGTFKVSTTRIE